MGAILYELLTSRPPFQGPTAMDVVLQVLADEPAPPRRWNAAVPRDLETVCLKCLEKEPAHRYPSALELAEDLRRFQAGEPTAARPVGTGERFLKWVRRRPTLAVYGLLLLLAVVGSAGGGAVWLWQRAEDARKETENALAGETKARKEADDAKSQLDQVLYLRRVSLAFWEWKDNEVARADQLLRECPE